MERQVNGPAAAHPPGPVHELGAVDREDALARVPFVPVVAIPARSPLLEHGFQGESPQAIQAGLLESAVHAAGGSGSRKPTQPFMLMTWLFWVSRSASAAVR